MACLVVCCQNEGHIQLKVMRCAMAAATLGVPNYNVSDLFGEQLAFV